MKTLRPYQEAAVKSLLEAKVNTCRQAPTGTGKTVEIEAVVRGYLAKGISRIAILAPNKEIVDNIYAYFESEATRAYTGRKPDLSKSVLVSTYGTAKKYLEGYQPQLVIVDECFPAGTLVDGKPIEQYQVGDYVTAWDEKTGELVRKRVTHVFQKEVDTLLKLRFSNSVEIVCTPNHPFYTLNRGWVNAESIRFDDELFYLPSTFFRNTRARTQATEGEKCCVFSQLQKSPKLSDRIENKQSLRIRTDETKQPVTQSRSERESERDAKKHRSQTINSGRQRETTASPSATALECSANNRQSMASRVCSQDSQKALGRISIPLQGRYCAPTAEDSTRNRWGKSYSTKKTSSGQEKNSALRVIRLASAEVLQPVCDGEPARDFRVFNLEVEDVHTYFAEGVLVHNCHHAVAATLSEELKKFNVLIHGFTATPNRLDGRGLNTIFCDLIPSPPIAWFIENNYLSPYRLRAIECPIFSSGSTDNLSVQSSIFGARPEVEKTVETYMKECLGQKTIIFCTGIEHASKLLKTFEEVGVRAEFIHAKTPKNYREKWFKEFKDGKLNVLINVQIFTEGVDVPGVQNIFLCRFTYSTALYLQMIGRSLRKQEGKVAGIYDLAGNTYYHGSLKSDFEWSLEGQSWRVSSNRESVWVKCESCDTDLVHKKYILDTVELCCTKCHHVNWVNPSLSRSKKAQKFYLGKAFNLVDTSGNDPETMAELSKLLLNTSGKKLKVEEKISRVMGMDVNKETKKAALIHLGVDGRSINFYLED